MSIMLFRVGPDGEWYARHPKLALALALLVAFVASGLADSTSGYPHHLLSVVVLLALTLGGMQCLLIIAWTMQRWRQRIVDEARIGYVKAAEDSDQSPSHS